MELLFILGILVLGGTVGALTMAMMMLSSRAGRYDYGTPGYDGPRVMHQPTKVSVAP